MLLGHEMQKRQFEVYFAPYCAAIKESDIQYVHSIMLNRPSSLPTPVFIIDEATIDPKNEIWFYLTKFYKSVIVLTFGVSRAPENSILSTATEHYPLELSYANKFYDSEMNELVDKLSELYKGTQRDDVLEMCEWVRSYTGGHMFPMLMLCQYALELPDWTVNYKLEITSEEFSKGENYNTIITRCFTTPNANIVDRFLRGQATAQDVIIFEKLCLWNESDFVSIMFKNHLINSLPPFSDPNEIVKLNKKISVAEKIDVIITTGLKHMESIDYKEPNLKNLKYEDAITFGWVTNVKRSIPELYISIQVQAEREKHQDENDARIQNIGKEPCVDCVFNGDVDVAIEIM